MDKKTVLAVVLSILVLLVFQHFYYPTTYSPIVEDNETIPTDKDANVKNNTLNSNFLQPELKGVKKNISFDTFRIDNKFLSILFNKENGNIHSVKIIKYKEKIDSDIIFETENNDYFTILSQGSSETKYNIKESENSYIIEFDIFHNDMVFSKIYTVKENSYLIKIDYKISNIGDKSYIIPLEFTIGPGLGKGFDTGKYIFNGPLIYDNKKIHKKKPAKVKEDIVVQNPLWIGYTSKYFLFAIVGTFPKGSITKNGESAQVKMSDELILNPGDIKKSTASIYAGPKEYSYLKSLGFKLEKSIDFGIFSFLSIPFLMVMNYFYSIFNNFGFAIILLTMIIKIVTFPLTNTSMASMRKMQNLQPEMKKIREKFKGESQKINTAIMDLYKKNKVNPIGGCLPMILQIPIFIALYKALLVSIELKGEPFIGWITDLSMKDPYYITPILMGISMFIQQRMTPSTGDPNQQKIFMLMPVIFTFLFINFPAGLVIYWLVNNVLTIIQQYFINKRTSARQI